MTEVRAQKSEVNKGTALSTLLFALSFLSASLLALCLPAEAQRAKNVSRIGFIGASSSSTGGHYLEAFRQGLRDLGYVEGENIAIEARWAEGSAERFPHLIAELIRLKIDVMVVGGAAGALAAKNAGITVPVVFAAVTDPLGYRQPRSAWRQYHRGSTGGRRGVQRKVGRAAQGDPPEDRKDGRPAKPNPPACRGFSQRNAGGGPGAWRKARFF